MAKPMPAAEVDINADLVRALLAGQHPDLASLPVSFLANGWDNAIFRLGDSLLARLPRRALGAAIIAHEQRWLPLLAPQLPLRIPAPERAGLPALGYPYSWSVLPYLPGIAAADALDVLDGVAGTAVPDGSAGHGYPAGALDLASVAAVMGGFLAALHVPAPADAPVNPFRGRPLADRADMLEANLEAAARDGGAILDSAAFREAALRVWADALAAPGYDGPPLWLHGDLHPANILVGHGHVSGVIDWGGITAGDPAGDLSVVWMLLPLDRHALFRAAYEKAGGRAGDDALWRRARGWALRLGLVFLAHSADNPQLFRIGRRTLATVLADA